MQVVEIRQVIDRSGATDRAHYLARLTDLEAWPADAELPTDRFVVFTAALDARLKGDRQLREFARKLLEQGCVYSCAWGPDAGRLEAAFDFEIVDAELAGRPYVPDDEVVMTVSDEDESFDHALWFAVTVAFPAYGDAAVVAICESAWAGRAESRLRDCRQLSDDVVDQEDVQDI